MAREVEVDAISNAIIETEREIAGDAWGDEETERDETGDRSLEGMGEGLEGQHEPEEDEEVEGEDADGEDADGETDSEGEAETAEADAAAAAAAKDGKEGQTEQHPDGRTQPGGRVPSGEYRKVAERARAAEAERDALKAQIEKTGATKSLEDRLELAMREIENLKRAPPRIEPAKPVDPPKRPDQFEDPDGFADFLEKGFQAELSKRDSQIANMRVETSMAIAHAFHKDTFEKAFESINKLNVQNPDDRATVQRIYNSPNPGEALVSWHKRAQTFAEVGDDPLAYRQRVAKETREALMKDPEFRKQLVAELRGEANRGEDGNPRTVTRLPQSLHRASGSNLGAGRPDPRDADDSDQGIAESAWR